MGKNTDYRSKDTTFIIIFTDLDGSLLDYSTYRWDKAKPALDICESFHIPIVMVSSKTRSEMDILRKEMGLSFPFISENGGGIFFPEDSSKKAIPGTILAENLWKWDIGTPYKVLVKKLEEIRNELDLPIRGFSEMSTTEISNLTGLDIESSRLAAIRDYDEPFIIPVSEKFDMEALQKAAYDRGLKITAGGRFFHIHGMANKGTAVNKLISWYKKSHSQAFSVALGDSPNDFSMFKQVNYPVLIRSDADLSGIDGMIPGIKVTKEKGPLGWNDAVIEILSKKINGGIS